MKNLIKLLTILSICLFSVMPALADGEETGGFKTQENKETVCTTTTSSYGSSVECKDIVTKTEIKEASPTPELEKYNTGFMENAVIISGLFFGGLAALILAQKQLKS